MLIKLIGALIPLTFLLSSSAFAVGASCEKEIRFTGAFDGAIDFGWVNKELNKTRDNLTTRQKLLNKTIQRDGLKAASLDPDVVAAHLEPFQVVIEPLGKVTDQEESGNCWINATTNELAIKYKLSRNYLYFFSVVEKVNTYLEEVIAHRPTSSTSAVFANTLNLSDGESEYDISDGGEYSWMMFLISKYGLVPAEAMPDTAVSLNTADLYPILRDLVFQTSERLADKIGTFKDPKNLSADDIKELEKIKREGQAEILKVLTNTLGFPPNAEHPFKYQVNKGRGSQKPIYKTYDPITFSNEVIKFDPDAFVTFSNTSLKPFNESYIIEKHGSIGIAEPDAPGYKQRFVNVNTRRMLQLIKKQIDLNQAVSIAIDVSKNTDQESGMIDQNGFKTAEALGIKQPRITRRAAQNAGLFGPDHAVAVVGYDVDKKGNITRLMIMNSWGPKVGQKGFFSMDAKTAETQLFEADISKDLISPNELEKWKHPTRVYTQKVYYGPG